jgi:hypothetical protein
MAEVISSRATGLDGSQHEQVKRLECPSEKFNTSRKYFKVGLEKMSEDVAKPYFEKVVQINLVNGQDNNIGCECAIRGSDNAEMSDEEIIRNDVEGSVAQDKEEVCLCFTDGIECYSQEAIKGNDQSIKHSDL